MAYTKSHRFEYHPKLRGRARTPDSAGGGPRARGGWRQVFLATLLYLVSISGGHFCNFWSLFRSFSGNSSQTFNFPEKLRKNTKNHKNALHTREVANLPGRAPPLADAFGGLARARGAWTRQYRRFLFLNVCACQVLDNFPRFSRRFSGVYFRAPGRSSS